LLPALTPSSATTLLARPPKYAHKNNLTLKEAALKLEVISEADFDKYVRPELMVNPSEYKPKN
jgi:fumarate hydratase class II